MADNVQVAQVVKLTLMPGPRAQTRATSSLKFTLTPASQPPVRVTGTLKLSIQLMPKTDTLLQSEWRQILMKAPPGTSNVQLSYRQSLMPSPKSPTNLFVNYRQMLIASEGAEAAGVEVQAAFRQFFIQEELPARPRVYTTQAAVMFAMAYGGAPLNVPQVLQMSLIKNPPDITDFQATFRQSLVVEEKAANYMRMSQVILMRLHVIEKAGSLGNANFTQLAKLNVQRMPWSEVRTAQVASIQLQSIEKPLPAQPRANQVALTVTRAKTFDDPATITSSQRIDWTASQVLLASAYTRPGLIHAPVKVGQLAATVIGTTGYKDPAIPQ